MDIGRRGVCAIMHTDIKHVVLKSIYRERGPRNSTDEEQLPDCEPVTVNRKISQNKLDHPSSNTDWFTRCIHSLCNVLTKMLFSPKKQQQCSSLQATSCYEFTICFLFLKSSLFYIRFTVGIIFYANKFYLAMYPCSRREAFNASATFSMCLRPGSVIEMPICPTRKYCEAICSCNPPAI